MQSQRLSTSFQTTFRYRIGENQKIGGGRKPHEEPSSSGEWEFTPEPIGTEHALDRRIT